MHLVALNAPAHYRALLGALPPGAGVTDVLERPSQAIHFFAASRAELAGRCEELRAALAANGMLWISWPKRSSTLAGDLDENAVREIGLAQGLVDVKVAAVDEDWSALKFVYRRRDRPA